MSIYFINSNNSIIAKSAIIFFYILFLFSQKINAQTGRGCYVGGVLYTENTGTSLNQTNRYFYTNSGAISSVCGFDDTGTKQGKCYLYDGSGSINSASNYTQYNDNFDNQWTEINCSIDDDVWILLLIITDFSILKLKLKLNS